MCRINYQVGDDVSTCTALDVLGAYTIARNIIAEGIAPEASIYNEETFVETLTSKF